MDRPSQRKSSIASFASRMSQRRPVSLLSRQGSIASLRSHRTWRQAIKEARIAYLDTRAKILDAFDVQSRDIRHWSEGVHNLHNPILSANGDIKSDFALLQRIPDETDKADLKRILCMVYGTDKLEMGSETSKSAPPPKTAHKPWGKLARSVSLLKQSFSQLKAESSRTHQQARQPAPHFPTNIIESDDMTMILNARATVLLNVSFRDLSQSVHVVKLSALALALWTSRETETDWGYGMFDKGSEEEENAWVLQRMIQLVRDDIYHLLYNAIDDFADADRVEQQQHIDIFMESLKTWQKMINRQTRAARGLDHFVESKDNYPDRMSRLRLACERGLVRQWEQEGAALCRSVPHTWNRIHDPGAEWTGPMLSDPNDRTAPAPIAFDWLNRKEDGFWFRYEPKVDKHRGIGEDFERVSA